MARKTGNFAQEEQSLCLHHPETLFLSCSFSVRFRWIWLLFGAELLSVRSWFVGFARWIWHLFRAELLSVHSWFVGFARSSWLLFRAELLSVRSWFGGFARWVWHLFGAELLFASNRGSVCFWQSLCFRRTEPLFMPDENSAYMSTMRHNAGMHPGAGIRQNSGLAPYPFRRSASGLRSCGVDGFCSLPLPFPFPFLQNKKTVSSIGISNF